MFQAELKALKERCDRLFSVARVARFAREQGAGLVVLPAGGYTRDSPGLAAAGMAAIAQLAP